MHLRTLARNRPHDILIEPDADARAALAGVLGITAVKKLRVSGALTPVGRVDWTLDAQLGATVVQPCVVTLDPVTTRIDEAITRSYVADPPALPDAGEVEMPEDDSIEALPDTLDLNALLEEALSLGLPPYPRAEGAELEGAQVTEPGVAPLTDEDTKPFAGLKDLKDKMDKGA
ncbi:MAG: YceD family protein [Pseudomonadota bacterium]